MGPQILILVGVNCKHTSAVRLSGFMERITEKVIGTPLSTIGFGNCKAPNPAIFPQATGYAGWSFGEAMTAIVKMEKAEDRVTLILKSEKDFSIMDVDLMFRWFFSPESVLNSIPVLTSPRG